MFPSITATAAVRIPPPLASSRAKDADQEVLFSRGKDADQEVLIIPGPYVKGGFVTIKLVSHSIALHTATASNKYNNQHTTDRNTSIG